LGLALLLAIFEDKALRTGDEHYQPIGAILGAASSGSTMLWRDHWHSDGNFIRNELGGVF